MEEIEEWLTAKEAEAWIAQLKKVFTVVRLLPEQQLQNMVQGMEADEVIEEPCQCYAFWEKQRPCVNCVSLKALEECGQRTKLEYFDGHVYQVIARHLVIEGETYILEMILRLDEDTLIDSVGSVQLMAKLGEYENEIYRDGLTGILNRRFFEEKMKELNHSAGVAIVDLDDFKLYNDLYGHSAGDTLLCTVVNILKKYAVRSEALIRYGGDEFLLLLPKTEEKEFMEQLQRIQKEIQEIHFTGFSRMQLSVSIGGTFVQKESIKEAVVRADKLMCRAKRNKNVVVKDMYELGENRDFLELRKKEARPQILIIDDSELNRMLLSDMLEDDFEILEAADGEVGIEVLQHHASELSLVLLDIVMPKRDGFDVLAAMNRNHWIEDLPVVMISSENAAFHIRRAYELGAADYISRPFDAQVVYQRVYNTMKLYNKQRRLIRLVTDQIHEKEKNNRLMVGILSQIVEFRNGESGLHVLHINILTELLLEQLLQKTDRYKISWSEQLMISTASALHDIGKIGINEKILNKPGKLTKEEFEIMKTHTLIGASMLTDLELYQDEMLVRIAYQICRWHHERYDGSGYPDGLIGDEIPIAAQIVSLADVYDALVSERVYKEAYSHEQAIQMIVRGECGVFNPLLMECLLEIQYRIKGELELERMQGQLGVERSDLEEYEKVKEHSFQMRTQEIQDHLI